MILFIDFVGASDVLMTCYLAEPQFQRYWYRAANRYGIYQKATVDGTLTISSRASITLSLTPSL